MNNNFEYILSSNGWSSKHSENSRISSINNAITEYGLDSVLKALQWVENIWKERSIRVARICREDIRYINNNLENIYMNLERNKEKLELKKLINNFVPKSRKEEVIQAIINTIITSNKTLQESKILAKDMSKRLNVNITLKHIQEMMKLMRINNYFFK